MMQHIINRKQVSTLLLLLIFTTIKAQYTQELFNTIKSNYKKDNVVQLSNTVEYDIQIKGDKLEIFLNRTEKYIFLKDNLGTPFYQSTYSSEFYKLVDYEANTHVFNNGKYKKKPVKTYTEKSNMGGDVFYDDVREYKFHFPGITNGSVVEFKTTHEITDPRMLSTVYLKNVLPVYEFDLTINSDAGVELDILNFNTNKIELNTSKTTKMSRDKISISAKNLDPEITEEMAPSIRYFTPHFIPLIRSYTISGEEINVLKNNTALYSWNYAFLKDLYNDVDMGEIKKLSDSITSGCNDELEKVESIFYWAQNNIKYIAFEYGLGGFVPRKPDKVLQKRYGDCKDNTAIMHALLKSAGINSYITWIGTSELPYTYEEVSSPASDNHMILTYIDTDSNYYFLDATAKYHRMGTPTSFIQGKEALISINEEKYIIKEVPVVDPRENLLTSFTTMELKEGVINGKGKTTLRGYEKIDAQYYLDEQEEKEQLDYLEGLLQIGNNKFVLKEYQLPELNNFDTTLNIDYTFTLDNYINEVSGKVYLNMNMYRRWLVLKPKKDRKQPIKVNYHDNDIVTYEFKIPEGYQVEFLPENVSYNGDVFKHKIEYEVVGNTIVYKHSLENNKMLINPDDMDRLREFITSLEKAYKQTVILSKK